MPISKNTVVNIHYRLSEAGGSELETNTQGIPMAYLHGHSNILPALEAALEGKDAGDEIQVTLTPDQAYGPYIEGSTQRVPIKHLTSSHKRLLVGGLVQVNTAKGPMNARILKVGKFNVDVDTNHPFAGKTLVFDISIASLRDATEEEIAHGHAHGDGGHHH